MKKAFLIIFLIPILLGSLCAQSGASFEERVTTASNVGMTINNLGMIGNSFGGSFDVEGFPSCEFPVGSGIEHVFDGGLWVGATVGGVEVVTTGAVDASSGYSTGRSGFEFSAPVGSGLTERSSLFDSPVYDPAAISHQDFMADFADTAIFVPGTSTEIQNHDNPLGLGVHFETYNWNFSFANFFVILNYSITNIGTDILEDVHLGFWADGVVRNVNVTPAGFGGSAFFNKGGNGYVDSLYMGYEFDAAGDIGFTESYFAIKFLGADDATGFRHPDLDPLLLDHYNTWQFLSSADPLLFYPETDAQRWDKLTLGLNRNPVVADWDALKADLKSPNNRSNLISVGPFGTLMPGQTINIAFAVVCAKKNGSGAGTSDTDAERENLIRNASWAQTAYNGEDVNFNGILDPDEDRDGDGQITRFILPSPPDIPETRIVPSSNKIEVYWTDNAEFSIDPISKTRDFEGYRLYKTTSGYDVQDKVDLFESLNLVAEFDSAGNKIGFDVGFEEVLLDTPKTFEGDTNTYKYRYTFENITNGWQHAVAVTAFDQGDDVNNLESLESSSLANLKRVFPGQTGNVGFQNGDPYVYPNPYYAGAAWEGASTFEEDRKIMFANLPPNCEVRIYTAAGDRVDMFEHNEEYTGEDIRWFDTYSDTEKTQFSGGEHAWDLLSSDNQIIARGIYLFSVKDLDSGKNFKGKFVVIK